MFQENQIVLSLSEFLSYKFPNAIKTKEIISLFYFGEGRI